jgi:hypothetical protein
MAGRGAEGPAQWSSASYTPLATGTGSPRGERSHPEAPALRRSYEQELLAWRWERAVAGRGGARAPLPPPDPPRGARRAGWKVGRPWRGGGSPGARPTA